MDVIEQLVKKLDIMSQEFQFLIKENRALKAQIKALKDHNDVVTRNNQDMILTIKNKLRKAHNPAQHQPKKEAKSISIDIKPKLPEVKETE